MSIIVKYFDKPPQEKCGYGKLLKKLSVRDCQTYFGFWARLLFSRKVVSFLYINALSLISRERAFAGKLSL